MTFIEAVESLNLKFTSGNEIGVTLVTITKEEWDCIKGPLNFIIQYKKEKKKYPTLYRLLQGE